MPRFLCLLILPAFLLQIPCFADTGKPDVMAQAAGLVHAGKVKEAENLLRSASAANPNSAALHGALGELLFKERNYQDSAMEFGQAAQQEPQSRQYNLMAAEALIGWKRYAIAVDFLNAIQPHFGKDPQFLYDLGLAYYYVGNTNAAQTELEEALRLSPNFDRAEFLLANNCILSGDLLRAIQIFQKLVTEHPESSYYWTTLGQSLGQAGNGPEAVRAVRKALALKPNDMYAQFIAATVFVETEDYVSARPLLLHLEKAQPKSIEVHALLARMYAHSGERELARKESETVNQLRKEEAARKPSAPAPAPDGAPAQP